MPRWFDYFRSPRPLSSIVAPASEDDLPTLYRDRAFWGMTATQFLGAFNDNLFKQLVLLLSVSVAVGANGETVDRQGLAMLIFSAPFLFLSGFAGYVADRTGKRRVIVLSKVAEVICMGLGLVVFFQYAQLGLNGLFVVLFLMGLQSTFFGPAKYGILPEMLRGTDLPRANGFFLMTTFLAIILGTIVAGLLLNEFPDQLWVSAGVCVAIAVAGTLTSLLVRYLPPALPELQLKPESFLVPADLRQVLRTDSQLLMALLVSSLFWGVGAIVPMAVNALGKKQLLLGDGTTSLLVGMIAIGIAGGCVLGGFLSKGRVDFRLVRIGAWGICGSLFLLSLSQGGRHLLGFAGSLPTLLALGVFTGLFAVPVQVFIQSRPPDGLKGRIIAVMNQANWLLILLSSAAYEFVFIPALGWLQLPDSGMFIFPALMMLPMAVWYHPKNEEL
jgi:acyl-[acyl-carrier-protein]-phospholipid O-acyltransferase/long-chain-fatty-acid--[acyl-carrier-protein] ligase